LSLKKILCIPDIQAPKHDETAVSTAVSIVKGEKPDILIHIGDLCALDSVATYAKTDWRSALETADSEIASANLILDRFDQVTPKKTKTIFLEGNHERRLLRWAVKFAVPLGSRFKGLNIEDQLYIEKRGYEFIRMENQPYNVGKIGFCHGWYANIHHAKATVEKGGQSLMYGHTHDAQSFTGMHLDSEQPRMAQSIGCLCKYNQAYLNGRPANWIHGVGIVYVDEKTGRFWPTFHPIIAGECVINGKVYNGS